MHPKNFEGIDEYYLQIEIAGEVVWEGKQGDIEIETFNPKQHLKRTNWLMVFVYTMLTLFTLVKE